MGMLADIGRADVPSRVTGFLKDVEAIKGERQRQELVGQQKQLTEIANNKAAAEEKQRIAIETAMNQPKTANNMFSAASQFAPKTISNLTKAMHGAGAIDERGITSGAKFGTWAQANPFEFQNHLHEGINEIDADINQKQRLITGYVDESGKFIPPDKNAPVIKSQIEQARKVQNWLLSQATTFEQELAKSSVKSGAELPLTGEQSLTLYGTDKYAGMTQQAVKDAGIGTKAEKIPIQSDKLQGAMAELGIDVRDPAQYTPENIAKASARLGAMEAEARKEKGEELNAVQRASIAHNLRTELRQDKYVKDFKDVDNKYQVMERALTQAGAKPESYVAVDQALITLYNKMTDPASVVRESEYARTPENMAITNRVLGKLDKWKQGGAGLTDVERNALIAMAREFHRGYSENYDQIVSDFEQTAKDSGIDPKLIGVPYRRKSVTKGSITGGGKLTPEQEADQFLKGM